MNSSSGAAGAAAAAAACPFSCVMLLAVHGAVFVDVDTKSSPVSSALRAMNLSDIGKEMDEDKEDPCLSRSYETGAVVMAGAGAVVSLVSPSNLGYSVMISANDTIPTHAAAFIKMITPGFSRGLTMDDTYFSSNFNLYENGLYSLSRKISDETVRKIEDRVKARATGEGFDVTRQLLSNNPLEMAANEFIIRNQMIREAIGLSWRSHPYAIGNKEYCPGANANQCCLYFPNVDGPLYEALRMRLDKYQQKQTVNQKQKTRKPPSPLFTFPSLSDNLRFSFDSHYVCVLTITFDLDDGCCMNKLWKGVSLGCFFRQVGELLGLIFHRVEGFSVEGFMKKTCVLDAACSDFAVRKKGVSIVSFTKNPMNPSASVSALLDVHERYDERYSGFWEYSIHHNQTDAARRSGAGAVAGAVSRSFTHSVVIPRELEDFVPACLTCHDSTIKDIQPVFGDDGNLVRVVYTYYDDDTTEEIDYVPSERHLPTESMEQVHWSMPRNGNGDGDGDDGDDDMSVNVDDGGADGGADGADGGADGGRRRRRRLRRTIKKKCMKMCKTKRRRASRQRRRCKKTQKNAVKTRGRRTCA